MAISFVESTGGWNSSNVNLSGSSSKNNYGFYIGVVETRTGDGANNTSDIAIQIAVTNNGTRFNSNRWKFRYTVDGSVKEILDGINIATNYSPFYGDCKPITFRSSNNTSYTTMYVKDIPHNDNGSKTVSIKVEMFKTDSYASADPGYCVVDKTFDLATIPRYFSSTPTMSVSNITETTAKISWTTPETCSNVQYRIGSSGNWVNVTTDANATSGSYTISGLNFGTNYTIYGDFKRRDSGLWAQTKPSVNFNTLTGATVIHTFDISPINETSINVKWGANHSCDALQCSLNGGGWFDISGYPNATVSGLSANTSYSVKIRAKRSDTQVWTESGSKSTTTYNYPYCSSMPDFTIGNTLTLSFYNPLGRSITINGIGQDDRTIFTGSTSGTSMTGFNDSNSIKEQYKSIPRSRSGSYKIQLICSELSRTTTVNGGTYSIKGDENPVVSDFTYKDIDSTTTNITGNNQILIDGYSDCEITIPVDNKAYSNHYADIEKYIATWGSIEGNIAFSSTTDVNTTISNSVGSLLKVKAVDYRSLASNEITKTITSLAYVKPIINNIKTERKNGIESETYLELKFTIWNGNWNNNNRDNDIQFVKYRCKRNNGSEWGEYTDITSRFVSLSNKSTTSSGIVYDLKSDDELTIHANGSSGGFEIGYSYIIEVLIADGYNNYYLCTQYADTTVTDGKVGMARNKDYAGDYHYGINGMPDSDYVMQFHGDINVIGDYYQNGEIFSGGGGGGTGSKEISIGDDTPTGKEVLWIEGDSLQSTGSEVVNSLSGNEYNLAPSVNSVNNALSGKTNYKNFGSSITDANDLQQLGAGLFLGLLSTNVPIESWYQVEQITTSATDGYCIQKIYCMNLGTHNYIRKKIGGTWQSWESLSSDKLLYYNASGTNGTVTLSENVANFRYLEIFYNAGSTKISTDPQWIILLHDAWVCDKDSSSSSAGGTQTRVTRIQTSGTTLTPVEYSNFNVDSGGTWSGIYNSININKVVGYR